MNPDIQRAFLLRLIIVTGLVVAARYFLVLPRVGQGEDLARTFQAQQELIEQGEQAISQHGGMVNESLTAMHSARRHMLDQFQSNGSTQMHNQLQSLADRHKLTITRIEPLKNSASRGKTALTLEEIEMETIEFRVECEGLYAGVIGYLDGLSTGTNMAAVRTFRMVPVGSGRARVTMQVAMHQLVKAPEAFTRDESADAGVAAVTGVTDDDA